MIIKPQDLIINRPEKLTAGSRALSWVLFLMFWAGLLYLMRPLLIIAGWALAYMVFDSVTAPGAGLNTLKMMLADYVPMIAGLCASLIGWAFYNRLRFRGARDKRRVPPPPLTLEEIASTTRLGADKLREMREASVVICYFDGERGELMGAKCRFDKKAPLSGAL
jgi:poly-beta-1,6-N-acetyl-D-glucosamine biosynthesis protein PgaD